MRQDVFFSLSMFPAFAAYLAVSLVLAGVFLVLYIRATPYKEMELIRNGNPAAALSLGGAFVGFAIALAAVIVHSVGLVDLILWGCIALTVQVLAYIIVRSLIKGFAEGIQEGQLAYGIFLGLVSLSFGILNAACMTP